MKRGNGPVTCLLAGLLGMMMAAPALDAASFIWTNSAGGSFNTAGNWKTNNVTAVVAPSTGDTGLFTLGSATRTRVTFDSSVSNTTAALYLGKNNAENKYEFSIADGAGSGVYDAGFTQFATSFAFRADLLLSTGTLLSGQVNIEGYDSPVTIVLDGPKTVWSVRDYFCAQQATLNVDIQNGARLEALVKSGGLNYKGFPNHQVNLEHLDANKNLVSHFRVTGPGSSAVFAGANATFNSKGEAYLEFLDGAYGSFSNLVIGCSDTNYTPRLVVSNATLDTAAFQFSSVGSTRTFGTAAFKAGAVVNSKGLVHLDSYNVMCVTATVDNSTWTMSGTELRVGCYGQSILLVTNGGAFIGTNALAQFPWVITVPTNFTNQVTVTGAGSLLKIRGIFAGGSQGSDKTGIGHLFVNNGAAAVQTESAADYFVICTNGLVSLSGGSITNASRMRVRGRLEGSGFVSGSVHVDSTNGRVRPGNTLGQLAVGGIYTQSVGTLEIQIGGATPGSGYDVLAVTNDAALKGGSVAISALSEYKLPAGRTAYDVVTAGSLSTSGVTITLPPDDGRVAWSAAVADLDGGRKALRVTAQVRAKGTLFQVR